MHMYFCNAIIIIAIAIYIILKNIAIIIIAIIIAVLKNKTIVKNSDTIIIIMCVQLILSACNHSYNYV